MKLNQLIFVLLLLPCFAHAQDFMLNVYNREHTLLNGQWEALVDLYSRGTKMGVYQNKTAQSDTEFYEYKFVDGFGLTVPRDWNSQREELRYYESSVWYKKDFSYTLQSGKRLFLYFGAVNYRAEVYLNGVKIGSHEGGFTPFQFEITDKIKSGNNFLIVHVNNQRSAASIPALEYDWWNYGGITRDVLLIETPDYYIDNYKIQLAKGSLTDISVKINLSEKKAGIPVMVEIPELKIKKTVSTNSEGQVSFSVKTGRVPSLQCWYPETPKLYDVKIATPYETLSDNIGFRSVSVEKAQILLNGKPVFLRGVNCHEEIPTRQGRSYSEADALQLLNEVKALNCNYVRFTHYPVDEKLIRLAEKMGLMIWEEIPLWQDIDFANKKTFALAQKMLAEIMHRDQNRCGIVLWSVANETPISVERNEFLSSLIQQVRATDNTRLVTMATDKFWYDEASGQVVTNDSLCQQLDVVSINRYFGWYTPWKTQSTNMKWKIFTDKPLIYDEFGGESLYGVHGDENRASSWSEDYQARIYADHIAMFANIPNLCGTSPWVLFDFKSPYRMNLRFQQEWNRKGLLSENGERKKAWFVMKDYYDKKKNEKLITK